MAAGGFWGGIDRHTPERRVAAAVLAEDGIGLTEVCAQGVGRECFSPRLPDHVSAHEPVDPAVHTAAGHQHRPHGICASGVGSTAALNPSTIASRHMLLHSDTSQPHCFTSSRMRSSTQWRTRSVHPHQYVALGRRDRIERVGFNEGCPHVDLTGQPFDLVMILLVTLAPVGTDSLRALECSNCSNCVPTGYGYSYPSSIGSCS